MKTPDIIGNPEGRKSWNLGWKWCEGKLLLLITSYFCRIQPTRGSYLKGRSNSHKFFVGYNLEEAPTSTRNNPFFIMLQHRKGQKSLNHNIKSKNVGYLIYNYVVKTIVVLLLLFHFVPLLMLLIKFLMQMTSLPKSPFSISHCVFYKQALLVVCIICRNMKWGIVSWSYKNCAQACLFIFSSENNL